MARIIPNINPIDTIDRKAVGFGFPLNNNAVFTPTYKTRDQIKANLINYLLTNHGERVFRPNFGSNLRNLLFENIEDSSLEDLKNIIQNDISFYFPEIQIYDIKFITEKDENTLNFILTYKIEILGIEDELNVLLN